MPPYFVKIIPVLIMFALGFFTKKLRIFNTKDADRFLQLVLNISLPALTFLSLASLEINIKLIYLIILPFLIVFITYLPANFIVQKLNIQQTRKGSFLIGSLIINTGFASTFIYAFYGNEAFGYYSLFDLGNSFMIYIFAYYQAIKYGSNKSSQIPIKKMLSLPPIWAIFAGLTINLLSIELNSMQNDVLTYIASPTMPLIIFALGIYFQPKIANFKMTLIVLSLRMGLGFIIAYLIIKFFNLTSPLADIILLCSSAPVGFNTLIFAELENLDREFAATIVSFSLILYLFFISFYSYFILK